MKERDFVVTNKGNYGKIISMNENKAMVKIGYNTHEIEIYNLTVVTDGTHLQVRYINKSASIQNVNLFIKHGTVIFDRNDPTVNQKFITNLERKIEEMLELKEINIIQILIP